ncbi:MAG: prephenate dehydratase domain-containing protein [Pyrinomonadaceae bacterium]
MSVVAIQGIRGSYSEEAATKMFGANVEILECLNFTDAFQTLLRNRAEYAVIPFKNKIVGNIEVPNELFKNTNLKILDEINLEIRHVLVGMQNAEFENLKTVCSHVEALKQCENFLLSNPQLQKISGADTASSVRQIVKKNNSVNSAIGSRRAAEIYGAKILRENIADDADNQTTFYLLRK